MPLHGRRFEIHGVVQGVGFRPWVYQLAERERLGGFVRNDSSGVTIEAFGDDDALNRFTSWLEQEPPPAARIRDINWVAIPFRSAPRFEIARSVESASRRISVPADLATCDDCLGEVLDPANRRHRYPFTNCTNCGPRYTIVRGVPYDRAATTMASFTMCRECRREYDDPSDRRFHAQPNACSKCGPQLHAYSPDGTEIDSKDAIAFAARALRAQLIVAVKGLGGFHLACDATSSTAVVRLRERKRREAKPMAVMVRDLEEAERLAVFTASDRALLTSVERPIVLVPSRPGSPLALEVSGDSPLLGLLLPYTPLHHLLLRDAGRPLVMTSGNVSDEPMVRRNDEAFERLGTIADVFLLHNRDIESPADDSLVRVIAGSPVVIRRARGYVPRAIETSTAFAEPVLAVGAHLKNTICIGTGHAAHLGPHVGDLETIETLHAFEESIRRMKEFVGVEPRLIAHDLHPSYFPTKWALDQGLPTIGVQHHHAHVVSAMAEHGIDETSVGVAYDGTGYGTDGTAWGGEILIADRAAFRRFATFRPIALAGGEQAIRQVWRIALALLDDAFEGAPPLHAIPLFRAIPRRGIDSVRRMIESGLNAPLARGVGRLFDAFGAIGLDMSHARYEGEVAFRWNVVADPSESGRYEVVVRDGLTPWEIDFRPVVRSAVEELLAGVSAATVSARFHNTLADVTIEVARAASVSLGGAPVVLSGGCFQNARLAESVIEGLGGLRVVMNREIPPGDGGLALGQAIVADAIARNEAVQKTSEETACV